MLQVYFYLVLTELSHKVRTRFKLIIVLIYSISRGFIYLDKLFTRRHLFVVFWFKETLFLDVVLEVLGG